jgi:3-oxoacyl-[acyl-carrier protein] reductase
MPDESLFDLAGRRALVTGGSRGIGAATARLLARCGADVALTYRTRRAEAEAVAKDITALGRRASVHRVELSTRRNVDATIDGIALAWDGLDILIGNAGIWPSDEAAVRDMPDERWSQTMAENVDGMFYSTRAALRAMRDGGRVVLVSSTAGQRGESMHADYAASKGAMISFVKSVAIEVARRGITVNSVARAGSTPRCVPILSPAGDVTGSRRIFPWDGLPALTTSPVPSCSCARTPRDTLPARSST